MPQWRIKYKLFQGSEVVYWFCIKCLWILVSISWLFVIRNWNYTDKSCDTPGSIFSASCRWCDDEEHVVEKNYNMSWMYIESGYIIKIVQNLKYHSHHTAECRNYPMYIVFHIIFQPEENYLEHLFDQHHMFNASALQK